MTKLVDGRALAAEILNNLKQEVSLLPFQPLFCDVLIGQDSVARSYVNTKARAAASIGLKFELVELPESVSTQDVILKLKQKQLDPNLAGLIIQLPLPSHLDKQQVLNAIGTAVDVDCLNQTQTRLSPPTAAAIMTILDSLNLDLTRAQILVVGQGELVGRPVTVLLKNRNLQVTTADSQIQNLAKLTISADVIISGTGQANLIKGHMIKPGAVVIDCGTAESGAGIVGDVELESVQKAASVVSPVPGGVGPVTVAQLLSNVVKVAKEKPHV
ncbi:MAG: hypothetical protein A2660_02795 [Candidatus Doudnabacteria bacterium RIFCSPHIGHO2_01_FULL_45_18]|uniref:Bifunctional protein FolD n=1 Tax=Candidatus Doudnabacteria bacterium RIFCSPHIGHO2_01_FULL_45_18 TaxID=1817823 RepID=A0A1F5NQV5_9BACT|nr:MAG: hypothetical protein A2660_02795 [Candidatus Doudnabacteria bacterium RIFCSPHIGHO2_01_FULL_45_18]